MDKLIEIASEKSKGIKIEKINDARSLKESHGLSWNTYIHLIIANIKNIDPQDTLDYILNETVPNFSSYRSNQLSDLRSLYLAYDLMVNGDLEIITKKRQVSTT
ncbi:hypothetical protein GKC32_00485 [Lactobacillus curvatus]|nr:hypothetical protein [Latilactobacillus curvatus]MSE22951.1 hypothetical protein [Latilactobacillus curvatus]